MMIESTFSRPRNEQVFANFKSLADDFAGKIRQKNISKSGFQFAMVQFLENTLKEN